MRKAILLAIPILVVAAIIGIRSAPHRQNFPMPMPTEHRLDSNAEKRNRSLRKQWQAQMHYAAPDADWKAIERENGRVLQEMRNSMRRSRSSRWVEMGSRNLAGRMHCACLAACGDSICGGSSRGGVWKGSLNGEGWRPISDNLYGGCHGVAVGDGPPEVVTSITDGGLVHYTADGGQMWQVPAGLPDEPYQECKRILRDVGTENTVYFLLKKDSASSKLFRSDDGGMSYTRIKRLQYHPGDIWLDRVMGGDLYLLKGNVCLRTEDQGAAWDTVGVIPCGLPSDVVLTGSEAGAPTLYAAMRVGGQWDLYRSVDAGVSWEFRYDIHDFWETLAASITNPDLVLFGGVEMWRSTDGAAGFTLVNGWGAYYGDPLNKLHADLPGTDVVWGPTGEIFYIATDGGLYRSDDGVATVTNISLEYLGVSQYYSTHTSVNDPDLILAGSQDQGYQRSTGPAVGPLRDFTQLISGDYGHLTSSDGTHDMVYSVYPGFTLVQQGEQNPSLIAYVDFPEGEPCSWMPYILADPEDPDAFFFCGRHLCRFQKPAGPHSWPYTTSSQDFTEHGGAYLTAFNISPIDHDHRLAVTNTGVVWYSVDAGVSWDVSPDQGPSSHYFYGTALEWSPTETLTAFMGGSGYSGPAVYRTTDGGVTWQSMGDGLPSTLVYGLVFEGTGSGGVYAASESGPYRFDPAAETWTYIGDTEAPITTYWCVEAVPAAGVVRFGTYGRGIWDYDYTTTAVVTEASGLPPRTASLDNYPNPFNPSTTLRYRLEKSGPVRLTIYNAAGQRVRALVSEVLGAGEHQVFWDGRNTRGITCASGVYIVRLEGPDGISVRRMTMVR
ncbi:MAG: T9SS type A sorting domain-containing protein [Candidatus Eisenbacteria sp.]|nr:T9SS type A sorting domain-containing protein [Candidatus Eisenbacteria bacterium]